MNSQILRLSAFLLLALAAGTRVPVGAPDKVWDPMCSCWTKPHVYASPIVEVRGLESKPFGEQLAVIAEMTGMELVIDASLVLPCLAGEEGTCAVLPDVMFEIDYMGEIRHALRIISQSSGSQVDLTFVWMDDKPTILVSPPGE